MNPDIVKLFEYTVLASPGVLNRYRRYKIPGEPLSLAVKCTGWEKFAIFDRKRLLYRKRYEIGR